MINKHHIGWNFNNTYTNLPEAFYTTAIPTPAQNPSIVFLNEPLAETLGLESTALKEEVGVQMLAGNKLPDGAMNIAQAYAGHQFGHFTKLGDGRAIMIGEH